MSLSTRNILSHSLVAAVLLGAAAGCSKKTDNTANFKNAVDTYYSAHPVCLWSSPKQFPVQANADDKSKVSDYDALVDQGLLTRKAVEKKKLLVLNQQSNIYDLSDQGRSSWTADQNQPGYGNFCYGHRKVASILSSTPTTSDVGATTQVNYQYAIDDPAGWAKAAETQNAFPQVRADLNGQQTGQATLTNTSNGWQVTSMQGENRGANGGGKPVTSADGKIVE